ncbi:MAG: hypothetical protein WBD36_04295 [Bacteroidota bacterium]
MLICVLAILLFPDPVVNRFIKPRITQAFAEAYPAYSLRTSDMHYSVFKNRVGFDSVALRASDGAFSGTMGPFSVSGIHWMHLLWGGRLGSEDFASGELDAQGIALAIPQLECKLRCKRLHVSVQDSEIVAESIALHPVAGDEQYFMGSEFRRTRFRLEVPRCNVTGVACLELMQGKSYRARSVQLHNILLDILLNKDKPNSKDTVSPPMPGEILSSIKAPMKVGNLKIMNGQLKYSESFAVGSKPAWVTFDSVKALVEGITSHAETGAVLVIDIQGVFVKAGAMKVLMSIPLGARTLSLQYTGSLSGMDLSPINSFLEVSDQMRIKTGVLQEVTFEVNVNSGRADGSVRGIYRDLTLAAIDKKTGSEKGFSNAVTSFIANTFKINKNNLPDQSGSLRIGVVRYTRERDDPFVRFVWFALRTGVRDVVGF